MITKHKKELNSFLRKVNTNNLIWLNSLSEDIKVDLLFQWKRHKHKCKKQNYSPKIKHFIERAKIEYEMGKNKRRDSVLDIFLNNKYNI